MRAAIITLLAAILMARPGTGLCAQETASMSQPPRSACNCFDKRKESRLKAEAAAAASKYGTNSPQHLAALLHLADMYWLQVKYSDCKPLLEKALKVSTALSPPSAASIADVKTRLSRLSQELGNISEADRQISDALSKLPRGKDTQLRASALLQMGSVRMAQKQFKQAQSYFEESLALRSQLNTPAAQIEMAEQLEKMSVLYQQQGQLSKAEEMVKRAIPLREKLLGKKHPSVLFDYDMLSTLYVMQDKVELAEAQLKKSIAERETQISPDDPVLLAPLGTYAGLLARQGRHAESQKVSQRAAKIAQLASQKMEAAQMKEIEKYQKRAAKETGKNR